MAVDEEGALGPGHREGSVNGWITASFQNMSIEPARPHDLPEPLGPGAHAVGLLAHGVEAEKLGQPLHDKALAGGDRLTEACPIGWFTDAHRPTLLTDDALRESLSAGPQNWTNWGASR